MLKRLPDGIDNRRRGVMSILGRLYGGLIFFFGQQILQQFGSLFPTFTGFARGIRKRGLQPTPTDVARQNLLLLGGSGTTAQAFE